MRINKTLRVALVAALATGLWAGSATAQTQLKLNQVGAALALPLIGGPGVTTYNTVTNVGPEDRNLHFNVINANGWEVTDFDCPVTASETVLITYISTGPTASLFLECNQASGQPSIVSRVFSNMTSGILFIANETHECKDGSCTTNANDLFGDTIIVDAQQAMAYSAGAIPFQGMDPMAAGVADRDYLFDNNEYSMFPATLATNFIAPGVNQSVGGVVTADLVLFVLDGRANIGSQAALDVVFYDDEETPTSAHYEIDCFEIVDLQTINPNFDAGLLGSDAGHLYMTAIDADQTSNVHDNKFGNGNAIRVIGVHGWLVQSLRAAGPASAWARTLAQGMVPQDLDGSDVPAFDGL